MKKVKMIIVLVIMIVGVFGILISRNNDGIETNENHVETQETKIVLYYSNLETEELEAEYRNVNIKDIKEDCLKTIMNELLRGPQNEELISAIPKGTSVNSIVQDGSKVIVDLSEHFLETSEDEMKNLHKIYSVVNSLTELTEITEVTINVNGDFYVSKVRL